MDTAELAVAIIAVALSLVSLVTAMRADARTARAEEIRNLLGEKESVAFAGLRILRESLPKQAKERQLVLSALIQACVFERSSRARAVLYRVIEKHRPLYRDEFQQSLREIEVIFKVANDYKFSEKQFNLARGHLRLDAVKRVVEGQ